MISFLDTIETRPSDCVLISAPKTTEGHDGAQFFHLDPGELNTFTAA